MIVRRLYIIITIAAVAFLGSVSASAANTVADVVRADYVEYGTDSVMTDTIDRNLQLKELVVSGQKVLRYPDKDVWIISRSMRKHAYSVADMLGNVPGMFYDRFEKTLSYNGLDKIKILMDGKEKPDDYIKNLGHQRFRRVEVTPHPQGIYRDYDVLINLISYEHYEGVDLQVWGVAEAKLEQEDKMSRLNPDITFTYTYDKLNLAAYYDYRYYADQSYNVDIQRVYPDYSLRTFRGDGPVGHSRTIYHDAYIDGDYDISKKHSVSFRYKYSNTRSRITDDYMVEKEYDDPELENTLRRELTFTHDKGNDHTATVYYRGEIGRWKLYSDFNYNYYVSDNSYRFDEDGGEQLLSLYNNQKHYTRFNLSATRTMSDKATLSFGYVNVYKYYKSEDSETTSSSDEFRHQAFASLNYSFSNMLRGSLNGDAELIRSKYGDVTEDQWLWTVNTNIRYIYNNWNEVGLRYNCSVDYPKQSQLNPLSYKLGYNVWVVGNPALKANMSHSLDLYVKQNIKIATLSMDGGFEYSGNMICSLIGQDDNDAIIRTYRNIKRMTPKFNIRMDGRCQIGPAKKWGLSYKANAGYQYRRYRYAEFDIDSKGGKWNGGAQLSIGREIGKELYTQFGMRYDDRGNGYSVLAQGRAKDEFKTLTFRAELYSGASLYCEMYYKRPLKGGGHNIYYSENVTPYYSTYISTDEFESNHVVGVRINWRFTAGRNINKKRNVQYTESEDNNMLK